MNKNNFAIKKQQTNKQTKQRLTCHFQIQFRVTKWSINTYFQSRRNILGEIYISFGLNWRCKAIAGCCCSIPLGVKRMTAKIKGTWIECFHSRGQHIGKFIGRPIWPPWRHVKTLYTYNSLDSKPFPEFHLIWSSLQTPRPWSTVL